MYELKSYIRCNYKILNDIFCTNLSVVAVSRIYLNLGWNWYWAAFDLEKLERNFTYCFSSSGYNLLIYEPCPGRQIVATDYK